MSIITFAKENKILIEALRDRVSLWILGYIATVGPIIAKDVTSILEVDNSENIEVSIKRLLESSLIYEDESGELKLTERSDKLISLLGLYGKGISQEIKHEISVDLYLLENFWNGQETSEMRKRLVDELVHNPRLYSVEGYRYGFVDCGVFENEVVYGYFAQEYLDHSIKYDDDIKRQDAWDRRFANVLFIWPLNTRYLILQDARFFRIPTLDMGLTKSRILTVMNVLKERFNLLQEFDLFLRPYEREMSSEEMYRELMSSEPLVTKTRIELKNGHSSLPERLPVFNPREDLNSALREIIEKYEIPNVANAVFKSTKKGSLRNSALVKALALSGKVSYFERGRGENKETVRELVPTHIGKIEISEPVKEENIGTILRFIRDNLRISLTERPIEISDSGKQIRFEIY
jgi:hypothetical protein